MKEDRDLSFLAYCKNEDLKTLVDMLTHDTNGEVRISEQLIKRYCAMSAEKQKFTSMTRPIQKNWKGHFWKKSTMTPWDRWMRKNYAIWLKN